MTVEELCPFLVCQLDSPQKSDMDMVFKAPIKSPNPAFRQYFEPEKVANLNDFICFSQTDKERLFALICQSKPDEMTIFFKRDGRAAKLFWRYDHKKGDGYLFIQPMAHFMKAPNMHMMKIEALGNLAGGIAHDFNNILSIVDGYAKLIQQNFSHDLEPTVKSYLDKILLASQRGGNLTRQLLAFSRQKIMLEKFEDLRQELQDQIQMIRPLLGSMIEIETDICKSPLIIKTSPDVFNQIVMNIMINARDAMHAQGQIDIKLNGPCQVDNRKGLYALLSIRDYGCGMSDDVKKRIFEPFFTTKSQGKGTGLGLSTVHGLVQQLGGFVEVQSELGEGTCFNIYLPLVEQDASRAESTDMIKNAHTLVNKTIMVVEDEGDLGDILKVVFERCGMRVLLAQNGDEALMLQDDYEGKIDFVLSDIVMPRMHGGRLGKMLEDIRPEAKVIYMSGYPSRNDIDEAELPPPEKIIPKPVDANKIVYLMQQMVHGATENEINKIYRQLG